MYTNFSVSQTQFKLIQQHQTAYRLFGQGSPIIFYNRFRGIMDTWDPLFMDSLAQKHTVVLFDYQGIGDSEGALSSKIATVAATGIELMTQLGFNKFDVAGWSYGGLVAQAALFNNPDRVEKLVLIGTNPPGENKVPFDKAFFEHALKPVNDLEDQVILFFEPGSAGSRAAATASVSRIAKRLDVTKIPSKQEQIQGYLGGAADLKADAGDFRGRYQSITNPVLVISSDHDISFAVENWFPLLRQAPTMQHIIINDTGHGLQHQHPVLIANYIKVFLSR